MNVGAAAAATVDPDELLERLRTNSDPDLTKLTLDNSMPRALLRPAEVGAALLLFLPLCRLNIFTHGYS
jgi:hypothetical protein